MSIDEITKKRQQQIDKAEQLKAKLNAQAVNVTGDTYNISFGSHAERYTEEQANRILDAEDAYMGESEYRQVKEEVKKEDRSKKIEVEEEKPVTVIKGKVGIPVQTEPEKVQEEKRQETLQGFRDSKTVEEETDQDAEQETKKVTDTKSDPNMPGLTKGYKRIIKKSEIKKPARGKTGRKRTGNASVKFGKNL